jgi:hypothetical protein
MSDRPETTGASGGDSLFKQMDEQERIYAPQEIPGGVPIPEEVDQRPTDSGRGQDNENIVGVIPVRPEPGMHTPLPVPTVTRDRDENEGAHDTTQGRG